MTAEILGRLGFDAALKLGASRNYDACLREWISIFLKFLLLFLWLLIFIVVGNGFAGPRRHADDRNAG